MALHPARVCTDCGVPVDVVSPDAPVGAVRVVGRNGRGDVVELCPRCFMKRGEDARPLLPARGRA